MSKLSSEREKRIINAFKPGKSYREIARIVGESQTTVRRVLKKKNLHTRKVQKGRKKLLTGKKEKYIVDLFKKKRASSTFEAAVCIKDDFGFSVSKELVRKTLKKYNRPVT
ncbi:hypothetical protein ENBRE01_3452 [Enteropsectra breve]|nr:hypothetical protein ENBRE01_3452 [Enteropsectra breve]